MTVVANVLRAEPHVTVGSVIQRDAAVVIERWIQRATEEQPNAKRLHHATLLDHLPHFLQELGKSLMESDDAETNRHHHPAMRHGEERWQSGWSLGEVVQDYQIMRLVLLEHLNQVVPRPLHLREVMAIGLALDEAIAASVNAFMRQCEERFKRADEALSLRAETLRQVNERKDEFLALLSHELRNPLAPIRNAVEVLRLRGDERASVDWAHGVLGRQVQHLTRLVEDIFAASRVSRGKIDLRRERLDFVSLVRDAVEDRRSVIANAGLSLQLDLPFEPLWVHGDSTRLTQVVGNLLHNAVKFTERGGKITVRVAREEAAQRALLEVKDTGIGIEAELLGHVFETFMQGDRKLERAQSGLGIGLALVKGLVELHGGEVRAASSGVGHGAQFSAWIPLAPEPAPTLIPQSIKPVTAVRLLRILLIEDNNDAAESLRMLLTMYGHEVAVAPTGAEGIEAARRHKPDVVLCDLGLPGLSGYAVATTLRSEAATAGSQLIALSGYGSETDQQRCREAGFDLHISKPVDPVVLLGILRSVSQTGACADVDPL